jgi:NADH-quinone oxidoreductase subunit F
VPIVRLVSENFGNPQARDISWYQEHGGYEAARKAMFEMTPKQVTEEVIRSNLRGLGGAGFPTGRKWSFVPADDSQPRYLTVNADEAEPGTFKDRYILEWDPHRLIEGILICCWAVGIHTAYIYIRGEYVRPYRILQQAVDEAYREGVLGGRALGKDFKLDLHIHRGAGAYICGEETGLLQSLEGKKGWPRLKPPFPAVVGLFNCPTVINNVETLSHLRNIILKGGQWFADIGSDRNGGARLYALSGRVKRPGVYELPMGTPMRELIYEHGGGILHDHQLKAVIPGGASAPVLKADQIDVRMDFDTLAKLGSMAGSAGVVVMDETVCMVKAMHTIADFFFHESCGQCTPCREGTGWVYKILSRILAGYGTRDDHKNLLNIAHYMSGTAVCALSDGASMAYRGFLTQFPEEFEYHVKHKKCDVEERLLTGAAAAP